MLCYAGLFVQACTCTQQHRSFYIRTVCPLAAVRDGDKYSWTVTCHKNMKVFHCPPCAATCCLPVTHAADFYQCSMTDALSWWQRAHFWHPKQRQFVERSDCWLSALFILITANSALWLIGIRTSIYLPVYLMKSGRLPLSFGAVKAQWCCVCIYTENMQGLR